MRDGPPRPERPRPRQAFDAPWLRRFVGRSFGFLSPTTWTTLSLLIAIAGFAAAATERLPLAVALFVIAGACDFMDGKVARVSGRASPLGAFWDGTVDRFVDALVIAAFFFVPFDAPRRQVDLLLYLLLFVTLMPPFVVAYANHRGAVPDPTETVIRRLAYRAEPLVLLGASALVNPLSRTASFVLLLLAIALMVATLVQTIVQVFLYARRPA